MSLTKVSSGMIADQPAFSAYQSVAQTLASTTITKITFTTEEFDTNSCYDTSTSRFTPTVAGYYQINGSLNANAHSTYFQGFLARDA